MSSVLKLLYPGMRIKRWLGLLLIGITFISLGTAYLMTQMYRTQPFPEFVAYLTLQFIDRTVRGIMFMVSGVVIAGVAILQLNRSLLAPFLTEGRSNIVDILHQHRNRQRGPRIVAIGGGTGLSTLLRGLKEYTDNLTAIVTVADDGGSSGRLRQELGILPPGDFRQCLVALADVEPLMTRLFQYRFTEGQELGGHSFGNLFIAAMTAITGNFERALRESSRVLAVRGQILPSTLENLRLVAEFEDNDQVTGESAIPKVKKRLRRLLLQPRHPAAYPEAIRAILEADLIVVGPGSLYTSVMPNLLVEDITRSIRGSRAVKVFVCNVATEDGETEGFAVADYIRAVESHVGPNLMQYVLVNSNTGVSLPGHLPTHLVTPADNLAESGYTVVMADVIDAVEPRRHHPKKLAQSLLRIYYARNHISHPTGHGSDRDADRVLVRADA
ncbi:MAG TPA: gluconeogenesis factor YvcK family protein [Chloroflexota bacterium]|nr:gluconeogenesis factor YvcK family protein [Chloroflexota bacterium]